MAGAAYECTASCTDDETFTLTFVLANSDGSVFDVSDYAFEYSLKGCGEALLLTEGSGVTINAGTGTATISPGIDYRLRPGLYDHGFRKRDLTTDQVDQIFDGSVTVTEGNF